MLSFWGVFAQFFENIWASRQCASKQPAPYRQVNVSAVFPDENHTVHLLNSFRTVGYVSGT